MNGVIYGGKTEEIRGKFYIKKNWVENEEGEIRKGGCGEKVLGLQA